MRMHTPPHPGELLREFLPEGLTIEVVAQRAGRIAGAVVALTERALLDVC